MSDGAFAHELFIIVVQISLTLHLCLAVWYGLGCLAWGEEGWCGVVWCGVVSCGVMW